MELLEFMDLADNSISKGLIVSVIGFVALVIIGANDNYKEKLHQKKYLMTVYFLLTVVAFNISTYSIIRIFEYSMVV